jgi:hypothetical protein
MPQQSTHYFLHFSSSSRLEKPTVLWIASQFHLLTEEFRKLQIFFYYPLHCTVDWQFWPPSEAVVSAIDDISISFSHCCCLSKATTKLLHFCLLKSHTWQKKHTTWDYAPENSPHLFKPGLFTNMLSIIIVFNINNFANKILNFF